MLVILDFLVTFSFFGFLLWGFYPRYRFVSATVNSAGLITLSIERYRKLLSRPETLTYQGHGGPWFSALDSTDGEKADLTMNTRLDSFLEFARETGQLEPTDEPTDGEAACCGC